jgi:NADPH:quinone reductase-like Zn-dependent oxidoreductase
MKAVNVRNGTGPSEALFIDDIPDPDVTGDKVLVRIHAFGLNRMDLMQREGKYPMKKEWGNILGVEFSGIVEAKGPDGKRDAPYGDSRIGWLNNLPASFGYI